MTLRDQLIRDEGERRNPKGRHIPYYDSMGKITIGWGRNLTDTGCSDAEAEQMLENDITDATTSVLNALPWAIGLDEPRFAVLVNMAFNMGIRGLLGFRKTLEAVARADYETAANEMINSDWREQVGQRAERLAQQMRSGVWV